MKFELSENQMSKLKQWKEAIKTIHGEYGSYVYSFMPAGIGDVVTVECSLVPNKKLDLTEIETW
jgi:hypothetical protein